MSTNTSPGGGILGDILPCATAGALGGVTVAVVCGLGRLIVRGVRRLVGGRGGPLPSPDTLPPCIRDEAGECTTPAHLACNAPDLVHARTADGEGAPGVGCLACGHFQLVTLEQLQPGAGTPAPSAPAEDLSQEATPAPSSTAEDLSQVPTPTPSSTAAALEE